MLFAGLCDCFCGVFLCHKFSEMVYFFNYFCMLVSVLCFLFVWLLAEGLYTVVPSCFDLFLGFFFSIGHGRERTQFGETRGV